MVCTHVVRHPRTPGRAPAAQRLRERQRSWRRRYRWWAGIEGRIHRLRRDDGLARCRSHGLVGLERDVGWGYSPVTCATSPPRRPGDSTQARSGRHEVYGTDGMQAQ